MGFPLSVSRARSMAVLVQKFARRDGSEQSGSVKQEASINGSPEIQYETVTGRGIEAIVNSLVSKRNLLDARRMFDEMPLFKYIHFVLCICFLLRQSTWVVSILFASIILLRRDGTALWGIIGSVSNLALSVVLKRILNQARPATTSRPDPEMPSTHAQSISFIFLFVVLSGKQLKRTWN